MMVGTLFLNVYLILNKAGPELCPWSHLWEEGVICSCEAVREVFG